MPSVVEAIAQVDALIAVLCIVCLECSKNSQLYPRGISVFLHRADDLDCDKLILASLVACLNNLSKRALAKELLYLICRRS